MIDSSPGMPPTAVIFSIDPSSHSRGVLVDHRPESIEVWLKDHMAIPGVNIDIAWKFWEEG